MKKTFLAALIGLLLLPGLVQAALTTTPTSLTLTLFQVWVGTKSDCAGLSLVYDNPSATPVNIVSNPTFGTADVPNGTYSCVVWQIGDNFGYTAQNTTDDNACVASTAYTMDTFHGAVNGPGDIDHTVSPAGVTTDGHGTDVAPVAEKMYVYFSTVGTYTNGPNMGPTNAFNISAPWVVNGSATKNIAIDITNSLKASPTWPTTGDGWSPCRWEPVATGISHQGYNFQ
jgi:hypothetical protein